MVSQLSPIAGMFGRAMVCDRRVARASGHREPYSKIADFITDLEATLASMPCTGSEGRVT